MTRTIDQRLAGAQLPKRSLLAAAALVALVIASLAQPAAGAPAPTTRKSERIASDTPFLSIVVVCPNHGRLLGCCCCFSGQGGS